MPSIPPRPPPELDVHGCAVHIAPTQPQSARASRLERRAVRFSRARRSGEGGSFFGVTNRIFQSGFTKPFQSQETGIALTAGETFGGGIVTTGGGRKIDAELDCFTDDFGFRKFD